MVLSGFPAKKGSRRQHALPRPDPVNHRVLTLKLHDNRSAQPQRHTFLSHGAAKRENAYNSTTISTASYYTAMDHLISRESSRIETATWESKYGRPSSYAILLGSLGLPTNVQRFRDRLITSPASVVPGRQSFMNICQHLVDYSYDIVIGRYLAKPEPPIYQPSLGTGTRMAYSCRYPSKNVAGEML